MRIVYLTLAVFILINIGAACRTPPLAGDCQRTAGGLARCPQETGLHDG